MGATPDPLLKDALPAWLDAQERKRAIRHSTASMYGGRPKGRVYADRLKERRLLGDVVDKVTREPWRRQCCKPAPPASSRN